METLAVVFAILAVPLWVVSGLRDSRDEGAAALLCAGVALVYGSLACAF